MKKNFRLVLALVLAAMMIVSMIPVVAGAEEPAHAITVSNLMANDKTNFYKILEWSGVDTDSNAVNGWKWNSALTTVTPAAYALTVADLQSAFNQTTHKMELTAALAGKIARAVGKAGLTPLNTNPIEGTTATYDVPAGTEESQVGLYMAIITPADQDVVYNPVFVSINWGNNPDNDSFTMIADSTYFDLAAAKKSVVTLEKTASHVPDYTDANATTAGNDNGDTVKSGDILDFVVETTIPGYGNTFEHPMFKLTDTLKNMKLEDVSNSFAVYPVDASGNRGTALVAGDNKDYTTTAAEDGTTYQVVFTETYLKSLVAAQKVAVVYKAEITAVDQYDNVVKEKNTVTLEYSHDPSTETEALPGGEKEYKKDITNHYTFSIDADTLVNHEKKIGESGSELVKTGTDKDGNPITEEKTWSKISTERYVQSPLAGAVFTLYKVQTENGAYKVDSNGKYIKDENAVAGTATTDEFGRMKFEDLDAGAYVLVETSAPAGYVKNTQEIPVLITATMVERTITEYYDQAGNWYPETADGRKPWTYKTEELGSYTVKVNNSNETTYTFNHTVEGSEEIKWNIGTSTELPTSINNVKGVELPSTGGIGTTIFYVGGSILVLAAAILLVTKRRMGAED